MRKAFASAAILVSSAFALTIEQEHRMGQTLAQPQMYPTDLAMTMDGDAVDISDYTAPEDDGTWQVQGEKNALPKIRKKVWKWIKKQLEEAKKRREEECDDSDCDDDKCDPNDSDCNDDDCDGDDCDDEGCDPNDSDCDDGDCDDGSCDPDQDDSCDGDDCDDGSCDDGSCDPDQDDSSETDEDTGPTCENVMHKPQSEAEYNELVASAGSKPILVKFGTQGCGACKHIKEYTEQLAKDTDCRKMMFIDGDLNKIGKAWYPYNLQYIPTFVVLIDGEEAHKEVTTNESKIQAMVDNYGLSEDEYCDDCDDDTCDGDSCEPDKDDTCDGDDCDDGSCDDGSCEPDKDDSSEPSCENVMHKPQSEAEYNELVSSAGSKPILVKFGTQGCGACKHIKEYTEQLAADTDCRKMMFIDGDLNKIGKAWYPYQLQYIPTFVVLIDGDQAHKEVTTSQDKIQAMVDNYGLSEDEYCDDCGDDTCDGDSCEPDQEEDTPCVNEMLKPQSQAEYEQMVKDAGSTPVMVKFGTQGCGACRNVKAISEQIATETDCSVMKFIDGDLNKIGSAWYPYKLQYIPTFVILQDGKEVAKKVTTRESDLRGMVSQYGANQETAAAQLAQLRESTGMQHPQSADEFDEMIAAAGDLPVQVKFTMNDCEACEYCEDSSDEIAASVDSGDMQFIEANINLVGEVRYRYDINAVPTFIVVSKGREIAGSRFEGGDADQIQSQVDKYSL